MSVLSKDLSWCPCLKAPACVLGSGLATPAGVISEAGLHAWPQEVSLAPFLAVW